VQGPTPSEEDVDGTASIYRVSGADGVDLDIGDISWDNGERSLTVVDRLGSPARFDGVVGRLRMSVTPLMGRCVVELSAARFTRADRPSLTKVDLTDLAEEIGADIEGKLRSFGASDVGTKEEVLGVQHQRRGYWCALFDDDSPHVPAVAYFLTRIVPVHLGLRA
jgi:hypothetical protein